MTLYYEVVIYERRNYLCVPSRNYAAWSEDLVLAFRPGEIIPSYGLRDMERVLGRELVISGYERRDHGAGIGCRAARVYPDIRGLSRSGRVNKDPEKDNILEKHFLN
ncbi:hypothetical protein ACFX1T_027103 [Malus domestica]